MVAQPRLIAPDAELVVLALLGVVIGFEPGDRGYMSLVINGVQHTPKCPFGQWLTPNGPRPQGDPCSERCETAQWAVSLAVAWLVARREPLQDVVAG